MKAGKAAKKEVQGTLRQGAEIAVTGELREAEAAVAAQLSWGESPNLVSRLPGHLSYAQHYFTGASPVIGVNFNNLQYCITT